jgi:hypothetical protein
MEAEFFVFRDSESGGFVPMSTRKHLEKPAYDVVRLLDNMEWMGKLIDAINGLGWDSTPGRNPGTPEFLACCQLVASVGSMEVAACQQDVSRLGCAIFHAKRHHAGVARSHNRPAATRRSLRHHNSAARPCCPGQPGAGSGAP